MQGALAAVEAGFGLILITYTIGTSVPINPLATVAGRIRMHATSGSSPSAVAGRDFGAEQSTLLLNEMFTPVATRIHTPPEAPLRIRTHQGAKLIQNFTRTGFVTLSTHPGGANSDYYTPARRYSCTN